MGYGTPEKSTYDEYAPEGKQIGRKPTRTEERRTYEDKPFLRHRATQRYKEPTERSLGRQSTGRATRVITGIKSIGRKSLGEAHGFAKEIRREGVRSAYKTERSLQRESRAFRRAARQPRTRIRQYRPATPSYQGLGERAVAEASSGWIPHLDRDYFGTASEQRDLIGTGTRDMSNLINTVETNLKKKEQRYY